MADDQRTVAVFHGGIKKHFTFPKGLTVQQALDLIGKQYKQLPSSIYLLYQGIELAEDTAIGDVFPSDRIEEAHLVSKDPATQSRRGRTPIDPRKRYYGYCKTCKACVVARPVFHHCGDQAGKFRLKRPEALDLHEQIVAEEQLAGECLLCKKMDATARVSFVCAEEGSKIAFLKSVRWNTPYRVACMMCQDIKERVIVFLCERRHSLCLECFSSYCKVALGSNRFSTFECGYSICCPGTDESCSLSPLEDPHHFQMVDKEGTFYHKYIEESAKPAIISVGNNVLCQQCQKEIVLSSDTNPATSLPSRVPGGVFTSLTRQLTRPVTSPVTQRSKVSCPECMTAYCLSCKKAWHQGQCPDLLQRQEPLHVRFQISPAMAARSQWTAVP